MDIFDRIASQFQKEARIPSVGNPKYEPCPCKNPKAKGPCKCPTGETWTEKEVKAYYDDFKGSLGKEWAKYEGAFDPSSGKMNQDRIKKNMGGGKGKKHDLSALGQLGKKASFYDDEIIDDLGLERVASFYDDEIIDDLGLERVASYGYQSPAMRRKPSKYNIAHRLQHLNRQKKNRMLTREEEVELRGLEERYSKSNLPAYARAFKNLQASFYDDEIIDDLGLDRIASETSWRTSTFSVDGKPPSTGEEILSENDYDPEIQEILEEVYRTGRPYRGFNMASVSLVKEASEIIDDLGFEREASDREAELLAEDLMVLADEIMSGKRRGPLKSSVRRAIGKALKKSLDRGNNLKDRTRKTRRTLNKARTQESKARARVRKQRRYNRYSR